MVAQLDAELRIARAQHTCLNQLEQVEFLTFDFGPFSA